MDINTMRTMNSKTIKHEAEELHRAQRINFWTSIYRDMMQDLALDAFDKQFTNKKG
jgi:hypothetical protein